MKSEPAVLKQMRCLQQKQRLCCIAQLSGFDFKFVRQDDKQLEAGVPTQVDVDCTDSAAGEERMLLQRTTA